MVGFILLTCIALDVQIPDKCEYYRWQRFYFKDLVDAKVIQVFHGQGDEQLDEQEEQSMVLECVGRAVEGGKL